MSRFDEQGAGRQAQSDLFAEPSERELAEAAIYLALTGSDERFPLGLRNQIQQAVFERWDENQH